MVHVMYVDAGCHGDVSKPPGQKRIEIGAVSSPKRSTSKSSAQEAAHGNIEMQQVRNAANVHNVCIYMRIYIYIYMYIYIYTCIYIYIYICILCMLYVYIYNTVYVYMSHVIHIKPAVAECSISAHPDCGGGGRATWNSSPGSFPGRTQAAGDGEIRPL